jgi:hypothetical protein
MEVIVLVQLVFLYKKDASTTIAFLVTHLLILPLWKLIAIIIDVEPNIFVAILQIVAEHKTVIQTTQIAKQGI